MTLNMVSKRARGSGAFLLHTNVGQTPARSSETSRILTNGFGITLLMTKMSAKRNSLTIGLLDVFQTSMKLPFIFHEFYCHLGTQIICKLNARIVYDRQSEEVPTPTRFTTAREVSNHPLEQLCPRLSPPLSAINLRRD